MTTLLNSLEGGTNGTTISSANSGGASGNAFNAVSIGGTGTLKFDNTQAAHGGLAMKCTTSAGSFSFAYWGASLGSGQTQVWFRVYCYITAAPAANSRLVTFWQTTSAGTTSASLLMNTAGKIIFQNASNGTILTSAITFPTNAWFRIEGFVTASATTGQLEFKIFTSMDSPTAADTQTSTALQNTAASIGSVGFGVSNSPASAAGPFWIDDAGVSTGAYMGPSLITGTGSLAMLKPSLAASGAEAVTGAGSLAMLKPSLAASGTERITGTGSLAMLKPSLAAAGQETITGTGGAALGKPALAASGSETIAGAGALVAAKPGTAASGTERITGTGGAASPKPSLAGAGREGISGTGGARALKPALNLAGSVNIGGPVAAGHAVAGQMTLPHTRAGQMTLPGAQAGQMTLAHAEGGQP